MTKSRSSYWLIITGVLLAVTAGGCVKFKKLIAVNPDGSGKMELRYGVSQQMIQMVGGDEIFEAFNAEEMIEQEENGWVAFTKPVIETQNGFKIVTVTGYFEDINQVVFESDDDDGEMQNTTYVFADGKLTVNQPIMSQMAKGMTENEQMQDPQAQAMLGPMLQGMEVIEVYQVPGNIQTAEGYTIEAASATATFQASDVMPQPSAQLKALAQRDAVVVEFEAADTWLAGSKDAWMAELADAKQQWAQLKEGVTDDD